jgi:hypothetical protein
MALLASIVLLAVLYWGWGASTAVVVMNSQGIEWAKMLTTF